MNEQEERRNKMAYDSIKIYQKTADAIKLIQLA